MIGINQLALLNAFASRENGTLELHVRSYEKNASISTTLGKHIDATLPVKTDGDHNERSIFMALEALQRDGFVVRCDSTTKQSSYTWNDRYEITAKGQSMLTVVPAKDIDKLAARYRKQFSVNVRDNEEYMRTVLTTSNASDQRDIAATAWTDFCSERGFRYAGTTETAKKVAGFDTETRQQVIDLLDEVDRTRTVYSTVLADQMDTRERVRSDLQAELTFELISA